ncbi:M20 family metallopeptidase [Paenibacillus nicotianae]|uniref:M20 family metallopeptidase n=1 Tax=Paenibacillus nicotianae TaxID=1526551 RepID=A0ABW4UU60_9BACL
MDYSDQQEIQTRLAQLLPAAQSMQETLTAWRRDLHIHPEIGYEEVRTSAIVAEHLQRLGLEVQTGIGKTGVVGLWRGLEPGPTIGLRADMDALPIQDAKQTSYASQTEGKAHLCGHDAHTTMLMGAAELLTSIGRPASGNIKFVFQPAEEGLAGADAMIQDGVLEHPHVDAMAGLHVFPSLQIGEVSVCKGVAFASADFFTLRIIGKGGHGARPHEGVDAITVSAQVISALQQITSRMIDPLETAVVSIGQIQGGTMAAAIASEVNMLGTVRTLSAEVRAQMPIKIRQVIEGIVSSFGADYELDYQMNYPVVKNDNQMVDFLTATCDLMAAGPEWQYTRPSTGGEDFAFYAEQVPAVFFRLGTSNGQPETSYPLHHPMFDLDESALPYGVAMLSAIALHYLDQPVNHHT